MCPARLDDTDGLTPFKEENAAGREQAPRRAGSDYAAHASVASVAEPNLKRGHRKRKLFLNSEPYAEAVAAGEGFGPDAAAVGLYYAAGDGEA